MQEEADVFLMRITVQMVDPICIKERGSALDAMHFIALAQQ